MMKKIMILFSLFLLLVSCGKKEEAVPVTEPVSENTQTPAEEPVIEEPVTEEPVEEAPSEDDIVDLTFMSPTAEFSALYEIAMDPEAYEGKTVKMRGFYLFWDDPDGNLVTGCYVPDGPGCCANGFQFVMKEGDTSFEELSLEEGERFLLEGTLHYDKEDSFAPLILMDSTVYEDNLK